MSFSGETEIESTNFGSSVYRRARAIENEGANEQNGLEIVQGADIGNGDGQIEDNDDQNGNDENYADSSESWNYHDAEARNRLFNNSDAYSGTSLSDYIMKDGGDNNDISREFALVQACLFNKVDRVTSLLNEGADVNGMAEISGNQITPIHAACVQGHLNVVLVLLHYNADMNKLMNGRLSSIHLCCIHGQTGILQHLLDSPKYKFSKGYIRQIFQLACSYDHPPIVELLLSRNLINVNERLLSGPSALYAAYTTNKIRLAELLLRHGATDDYVDGDGRNVLHHACDNCDFNFVKQMAGCNILHECADSNGDSALHTVCKAHTDNERWQVEAAKDILSLLLSAGFNVNSRNKRGETPFLLAAMCMSELIPILLEYECDVTIRDIDNRSALHNACFGGQSVDVLTFLLSECKLNVNDVDIDNTTAINCYCWRPNIKIIEFLIENGAEINIRDSDGKTALHNFVGFGNHDAIKALLDAYKRRIEKNGNSEVPLEMASLIDAEDNEGLSPLQMARIQGDKEAVKILLQYLEPNTVNSSSSTGKSFPNDGYLLRMLGISSDEIMSTIEREEGLTRRFMGAVYGGSIEEVRMMIDKTDLNSSNTLSVCLIIDDLPFSALDLACYSGNIHMVSMLYEYIPVTVSSDGVVISALLAYIGHHYDIVEYFLDRIQPGQDYSWLLLIACIDNQIMLVKSILDRSGDHAVIDLFNRDLCQEYYEWSMKKIDPYVSRMSELFRSYGINTQRDIYVIVFFLACYHGRVEIVELLLPYWKNQRHVHISDRYGPIQLVCMGSVEDLRENEYLYVKILRLLVSAGESVNETRHRRAPLDLVCEGREERLLILKELLDSPGNVIDVSSPLLIACASNYSQTISMLLDYGADVNIIGSFGDNPLHQACTNIVNPKIIQQLLEKKVSLLCQNCDGETPLHNAAAHCWEREVFELLLQTKQNTELGSPNSSSANDSNVLSSLLEIKDRFGRTALSIAQERGNKEAVEVLQRVGALM